MLTDIFYGEIPILRAYQKDNIIWSIGTDLFLNPILLPISTTKTTISTTLKRSSVKNIFLNTRITSTHNFKHIKTNPINISNIILLNSSSPLLPSQSHPIFIQPNIYMQLLYPISTAQSHIINIQPIIQMPICYTLAQITSYPINISSTITTNIFYLSIQQLLSNCFNIYSQITLKEKINYIQSNKSITLTIKDNLIIYMPILFQQHFSLPLTTNTFLLNQYNTILKQVFSISNYTKVQTHFNIVSQYSLTKTVATTLQNLINLSTNILLNSTKTIPFVTLESCIYYFLNNIKTTRTISLYSLKNKILNINYFLINQSKSLIFYSLMLAIKSKTISLSDLSKTLSLQSINNSIFNKYKAITNLSQSFVINNIEILLSLFKQRACWINSTPTFSLQRLQHYMLYKTKPMGSKTLTLSFNRVQQQTISTNIVLLNKTNTLTSFLINIEQINSSSLCLVSVPQPICNQLQSGIKTYSISLTQNQTLQHIIQPILYIDNNYFKILLDMTYPIRIQQIIFIPNEQKITFGHKVLFNMYSHIITVKFIGKINKIFGIAPQAYLTMQIPNNFIYFNIDYNPIETIIQNMQLIQISNIFWHYGWNKSCINNINYDTLIYLNNHTNIQLYCYCNTTFFMTNKISISSLFKQNQSLFLTLISQLYNVLNATITITLPKLINILHLKNITTLIKTVSNNKHILINQIQNNSINLINIVKTKNTNVNNISIQPKTQAKLSFMSWIKTKFVSENIIYIQQAYIDDTNTENLFIF